MQVFAQFFVSKYLQFRPMFFSNLLQECVEVKVITKSDGWLVARGV